MAQGAADTFAAQLVRDWRALRLDAQEQEMLAFTEKLTLDPGAMSAEDVERLRAVGFDDEDILAITVIAAWYNFRGRVASALGVDLDDEKQRSPLLQVLPWPARPG